MSLTREDVQRLADLARLELTEAELVKAEHELDAVLGYVERLQKIKTEEVEPQTMPSAAAWREDAVLDCDDVTKEIILGNFPSRKGSLLSVPAVFISPKK